MRMLVNYRAHFPFLLRRELLNSIFKSRTIPLSRYYSCARLLFITLNLEMEGFIPSCSMDGGGPAFDLISVPFHNMPLVFHQQN